MKLENHIVNRLLTDETLWTEMVMTQAEKDGIDLSKQENEDKIDNYRGLYLLLEVANNKTYYVTHSVTERLSLFDTKKCMSAEGWKIFNHLPDFKKTFILPDNNRCIRVLKRGGVIHFCDISFEMHPKERRTRGSDGSLKWVTLYVDLDENKIAEHFQSEDGNRIAPFIYALMCYVMLCDNQTIEVQPKAKYGTQKSGKIINILPFPITVINNTWNVTTIRREGFEVIGHSALRWTGSGRTIPKLVFIEPYWKDGYTRKSGKELENKIRVN